MFIIHYCCLKSPYHTLHAMQIFFLLNICSDICTFFIWLLLLLFVLFWTQFLCHTYELQIYFLLTDFIIHFLNGVFWLREVLNVLLWFSSVQSLSCVRLFVTPWIAARQASLSITNTRSSLKLTSIESVMPSSHLILCRPLSLLPPIPPSIRARLLFFQ